MDLEVIKRAGLSALKWMPKPGGNPLYIEHADAIRQGLVDGYKALEQGAFKQIKVNDQVVIRNKGGGKLGPASKADRNTSSSKREAREEAWRVELRTVLDEFGMSDQYESHVKKIEAENRRQQKSMSKHNKDNPTNRISIGHVKALDNQGTNLPDNRTLEMLSGNSSTQAKHDASDTNIRMSGTSLSVRDYVINSTLGEGDVRNNLTPNDKQRIRRGENPDNIITQREKKIKNMKRKPHPKSRIGGLLNLSDVLNQGLGTENHPLGGSVVDTDPLFGQGLPMRLP